ncbi:hypothetical protein LCGC14_1315660 [marine sediment metagenome]|uniref:Uncharacterized protein n=1 Tax=marine sediment metagenome TaxID=412755 RepID=A0A0F9KL36_9ZZZZ
MANDINMWQDIEELEKIPNKQNQAEDLLALYCNRYIEYNPITLERLKRKYIDKYGDLDNYV